MAVYADVTERKRVERALRETELRYRTLVEQLPVPTYIAPLALDHAFFYVSPAIESMLGYPSSAWVSTSGLWESRIHAEDRDRVLTADLEHMEHGGRFDLEYRLIARYGRVVWLRDVAVVLTDDAGHPLLQQGVLVDITERKQAEEALAHQALHDALTGLPNRTLLYDRLDRVIAASRRNQGTFALLLMDLDRFKEINDTFGHAAGDALLQELGPRLQRLLRESDTVARPEGDAHDDVAVARLGGDEFAVILPDADGLGARAVADRILLELRRPFVVDGQELDIGASVGIAIFPEHGDTADHLLQHAPAVRPPVDVVAQEHQGIECRRVDGPDQSSQRRRAAVNVANRYRPSFGHEVFVSLVLRTFADQPSAGP